MKKILYLFFAAAIAFCVACDDSGSSTDGSSGYIPQDNAAFLSDYSTSLASIIIDCSSVPDENSDAYDTTYTISGDISGNCVVATEYVVIDYSITSSTTTYTFNSYNDSGTIYTGSFTIDLDDSLNGSYSGTVTGTGVYSGTIVYHITVTGGLLSGYYTVNGYNYDINGNPM